MKIKKNTEKLIEIFNKELYSFYLSNPSYIFNNIKNTEEDYAEGSINFNNFSVIFRCSKSGSGYSFLEVPIFSDDDISDLTKGTAHTFSMLFKFDFSNILFSAYDIHNIINDNKFRTLCFHYVRDESSAVEAVAAMLNFIKLNFSHISDINENAEAQKALIDNRKNDKIALSGEVFDNEDDLDFHESLMYLHLNLNEHFYNFVTTGNSKTLIKKIAKAEEKNKLILFEKRYVDFLEKNNYQNIDEEISKPIIKEKHQRTYSQLFYAFLFMASTLISIGIFEITSSFCARFLYPDAILLGIDASQLEAILLMAALYLSVCLSIKNIAVLKKRIYDIIKDKYRKPLSFAIIICVVLYSLISFHNYKNNAIVLDNNRLYLHNEIADNNKIEFILIKGYEAEENGKNVYYSAVNDRQLLFVKDGEYEYYLDCYPYTSDENEGVITNSLISQIKKSGCRIRVYKTIEEYAQAHNFVIEE